MYSWLIHDCPCTSIGFYVGFNATSPHVEVEVCFMTLKFLFTCVWIDLIFGLITLSFSLWHRIKLWGNICSSGGTCLLNTNNVLRNGTGTVWHPLRSGGHLRRDERGWHLPGLPQITQCIPNERKTMPLLPTSCLIKRGQIHQCCSVVATWLPFSHHFSDIH